MKTKNNRKIEAPLPLRVTFAAALGLIPTSAMSAILSNPSVIAAGAEFPGYGPERLFDGVLTDYASNGGGAAGTWVELDFGAPVQFDRMVLMTRTNSVDVVGESRLIASM